ncbi:MAG: glycosyltransferase family 4 protein [Methylocella sp.]
MRLLFAISGDLSLRTGGYGYDRRVLQELPGCGVDVLHLALQGSFPDPAPDDVARAVRAINDNLLPGDVVLADGLAYGALPEDAIRAINAPIIALCHHPLGLETGLPPARRRALLDSERMALALAAHVIVTSVHTSLLLAQDFDVSAKRISVARPGVDRAARASGSGGPPTLLAVGSIIPRKGFDVLVEALAGLTDCDWRLRIAGSPARSPETATALNRLIEIQGLGGRVECLGDLSAAALAAVFDASDIFVSSSLYEGYGMALAEAMTCGLPIVATTGGAAADTVPDMAGLKVSPGDVVGLRQALRRMILDNELRSRLADASWRAGQDLPRWHDAALVIANVARDSAPVSP